MKSRQINRLIFITHLVVWTVLPTLGMAQDERLDFFESRIRPVLVEHCYECHNSAEQAEAGLALDWKSGIRKAGSRGPAVVPFQPDQSVLLAVIRHEIDGLEMPEGGDALDKTIVADFEKWIREGAVDPRLAAPTAAEWSNINPWENEFKERGKRWCYQPLQQPPIPETQPQTQHPIDAFIKNELNKHDLTLAPKAEASALARRLSFALTGLPPQWESLEAFSESEDPNAFEDLVDAYLESPEFGERWARHWMDLVRYADSHGSEGDPSIPHAYQYRDYLIRAFNRDVPYDQLITEHLAGDLLESPRINADLQINESAIGTAHLRLVFHGFAPTDALDEKVRFTDDQINVVSKAFLGLTVSCARCHNHKFDAISQKDYYAMFGVLGSCRPAMQDVNTESQQNFGKQEMKQLKQQLREALAKQWRLSLENLNQNTIARSTGKDAKNPEEKPALTSGFNPIEQIRERMGDDIDFPAAWQQLTQKWEQELQAIDRDRQFSNVNQWHLGLQNDRDQWFTQGNGIEPDVSPPGDFCITGSGDQIIHQILPRSVTTHTLSKLHRGVLASPRFRLNDPYRLWLRLTGGGQASVRYVIQNYPRDGTVYPIRSINAPDWTWQNFDTSYWVGDDAHIEFATAADAPIRVSGQKESWFGVREVLVRHKDDGAPAVSVLENWMPLYRELQTNPPESFEQIAEAYRQVLGQAIEAWQADKTTDEQALFLNSCLQSGLLPNHLGDNQALDAIVNDYRNIEKKIPNPTRAPGVMEADAFDQPLFARGDHKRPQETVPRRFLEIFDATPFNDGQSGRLALAKAIVAPENPLTTRVAVNRVWHYLFGQGLVSTPDNFGEMGSEPSHPELLDFLAAKFQQDGWSIKDLIRFIVTSDTWKQSTQASPQALQQDPENRLLSHANLSRLDAESIRDSLYHSSHSLDLSKFGPGFSANSTTPRRAIYCQSRRNSLDAFLQVFDTPIPFATTGRRVDTNVPAQSLSMMNDPLVWEAADRLANLILNDSQLSTDPMRIDAMFKRTLGRPVTQTEAQRFGAYLEQLEIQSQTYRETQDALKKCNEQLEQLLAPVHDSLVKQANANAKPALLDPIAAWDFTRHTEELTGSLKTEVIGKAQQGSQGIRLEGTGFLRSSPLPEDLHAKSLEVFVQMDDLTQKGGGIMTIQDLQGDVFDSVVFGEREQGHWMAGSDRFARTQDLGGPIESMKPPEVVHLVITYDASGMISAYRNGQAYGNAYQKPPAISFQANQARVLFGMRHGNATTEGRMWHGNLIKANLYDRVLSPEEINASREGRGYIDRSQVIAALNPDQHKQYQTLEIERSQLLTEIDRLGGSDAPPPIWTRVAHSIFNLKEFIYIQ